MWLNVARVRQLCILCHGYDPQIDGFDQKPFHMNESGSQNRKSLQWRGVGEVPLKECASSTRARWTANTYVTSRPGSFAPFPPLEIMFKGGPVVERRVVEHLRTLCAGGDLGDLRWVTVTTSDKGSYRAEHVVEFLRRHLPERTPETRWRILMCDVYGPHDDAAVFDLAWPRGVVLLKHGGGTTGRATAECMPCLLQDGASAALRL